MLPRRGSGRRCRSSRCDSSWRCRGTAASRALSRAVAVVPSEPFSDPSAPRRLLFQNASEAALYRGAAVVMDRGGCSFVDMAWNAHYAGASLRRPGASRARRSPPSFPRAGLGATRARVPQARRRCSCSTAEIGSSTGRRLGTRRTTRSPRRPTTSPGPHKGASIVLQLVFFGDRMCQKESTLRETLKRDDHLGPNRMSL